MKHFVIAATAVLAASASANAASLDYSFLTDKEADLGNAQRFWHSARNDTFSAESLSQYTPGATAQATADADGNADKIINTTHGLGVELGCAQTEGSRIAENEALFLTFNNETNKIDRLLSLTFYEEDFGDEAFDIYDFAGNKLFSGSVNVAGRDGDYLTVNLIDSDGKAGLAGTQFILAVTAPTKPSVKRGLVLAGVSGHIAGTPVSAVPLPASALLLLTGIGGLAFSSRRKKTA